MYPRQCKDAEHKITLINVTIVLTWFALLIDHSLLFVASEPRLARQQEQEASEWDQQLESIAADRK
jgi:hypothetical protein